MPRATLRFVANANKPITANLLSPAFANKRNNELSAKGRGSRVQATHTRVEAGQTSQHIGGPCNDVSKLSESNY